MDSWHEWQSLTTVDCEQFDTDSTVAVLPVAATEQHGPHLPLGTDALINRGILDAAAQLTVSGGPYLILPPLDVGTSDEHADFPGTLSVAAEHLLPVWLDLGRAVARTGIRKLVVLNSHGGQRALVDLAAVRLRVECSLLVVRANYFAFGAPAGLFDPAEWTHGLHGGEAETSLMMHLHPALVRNASLADFASLGRELAARTRWLGVEKPVGIGWKARDLNPAGVVGNAAAADPARGAAYLDHIATAFRDLLQEVSAAPTGIVAD